MILYFATLQQYDATINLKYIIKLFIFQKNKIICTRAGTYCFTEEIHVQSNIKPQSKVVP